MYNIERIWVFSEYMEKIRIKAYWVFVISTGKETMHLTQKQNKTTIAKKKNKKKDFYRFKIILSSQTSCE